MTVADTVNQIKNQASGPTLNATQQYIQDKKRIISDRFDILGILTEACIKGTARSLIVSGAPGLGKSYTVAAKLQEHDPTGATYKITKGYILATGLYKMLYENRFPGNVIVLDDSDKVFFDDISLGILKAVCDTTTDRYVSWKTQAKLFSEVTGELLPKSFLFEGSVIILTNEDFDYMIDRGHRLSRHFAAMISRSHYISMALKTREDYLIRISQVIGQGMLDPLPKEAQAQIMGYIVDNYKILRELSLRMALKIRDLYVSRPNDWRRIADNTCKRV